VDRSDTLDVVLHLDDGTTISGAVEDAAGVEQPFYGWLELSALLDAMLQARPPRR
jgi:hypothetical protein